VNTRARWWREDEPHNAVYQMVRRLRRQQSDRVADLLTNYCLYDDWPATGFSPSDYTVTRTKSDKKMTVNVIRSCVDTVRAEVIQSRPRPMFLTTGGEWSERKKGERLGQFVEGVFYETDFDRMASLVALEALLGQLGGVRFFEDPDTGRVGIERISAYELFVDERDAYYGKPRSLYLQRWVDREVLLECYEDQAEAIRTAQSDADAGWRSDEGEVDQVLVIEAWHLPSKKGATDGRHVICCSSGTLLDEAWEQDSFPIALLRWKDPPQGFWAKGLADELRGMQRSLNRCSRDIEDGQELHAHTKIAVERNSRINKGHFGADAGLFVEFDRTPPQPLVFPAVSPEVYQREGRLYQWSYETSGVSTMAARAEKPTGVQSGRAMRTLVDVQSKRFLDFQRAFENFYVEAARQVVRLMERLAANDASYNVVYRGKRRVERIEWNDVRLDESSYVLQCWPTNLLPSTPSGRLEAVADMVNTGLAAAVGLPPEAIVRLLDFPDTEAAFSSVTASWDLVEQMLEAMLDEGEDGFMDPEPFYNLSLCLLIAVRHYQQWRLWRVPEDRMELLRQWIAACKRLIKLQQAEAAASAPAPSPQGPPPGPANDVAAPPGPPGIAQGPMPEVRPRAA
jgi:hypothetical protein